MVLKIKDSVNTLEKCTNPTILSPAVVGLIGLFKFGVATCLGEGKLISNLLNSC